jgi:hypothetical protein
MPVPIYMLLTVSYHIFLYLVAKGLWYLLSLLLKFFSFSVLFACKVRLKPDGTW